ncbi:MAG: flagellar hook-basal body complex protein [Alphaproteobacteria bacterium]|nr:flagellar hook-basal body complex protein [Alphaproteobacteria bacterium]MBQ8630511.1 flagellar hook-basal body complex protein [Alphaproteobacteria bacterium]
MSLFGALQSGISGLAAQSTAMGAISDNIVNVNTVGYKNNTTSFQTLVTKQTSSSYYSPGGVQPVSKQGVNVQGLLASNSSSTALAISGNGYFVVNQAANPGEGDLWAYTRAGDFNIDENGYLKNTGGFYAQGWSLLPWDGNPQASTVNINGINYMKAYYASDGSTVYINDNIIDPRNLKPVNLSTIGGTATATKQISFGANLPSSDEIYNSVTGTGGKHKVSALIYDSLGNASNMSLNYYKTSANGWSMTTSVPSGASNVSLHTEIRGQDQVYAAAGQLEFTSIPETGSVISITTNGTTYNFQFGNGTLTDPTMQGTNIGVDITSAVSVAEFSEIFATALKNNLPDGDRFAVQSNGISITQSTTGDALRIDASRALSCVQSSSNPSELTGIPTGVFTIDKVSEMLTNGAAINFTSRTATDYVGQTLTIDGVTFEFVNGGAATGGNVAVDISGIVDGGNVSPNDVVKTLVAEIQNADNGIIEPGRFVASGSTLQILPTSTGPDIVLETNLGNVANGRIRNDGKNWENLGAGPTTIANEFIVDEQVEQGSIVPAVRFDSQGTPKQFYVSSMAIEWANGAQDMTGAQNEGTRITLNMGNVGTNDGLTNLSGDFTTNYIRQDGAKFGSYSGVSIDESGVVTALFDNGETRPIAILPLATFSNPNGLESLTGNSWIETDYSGQALLKRAGTDGAGEISSNALENSTVDLATEFSNMIVTQRAYSAATKIITTADEMLDELTRLT